MRLNSKGAWGYAARRMWNEARARSERYAANASSATSSAPQRTAARLLANLPSASKNESNESAREASGATATDGTDPAPGERERERAREDGHRPGGGEPHVHVRVVERQPHQRRGGVAGELERPDHRCRAGAVVGHRLHGERVDPGPGERGPRAREEPQEAKLQRRPREPERA